MHRNVALRRLWWKESRQLLPLVGLLVSVGAILQLLVVLLPLGNHFPWRQTAALLGMPGLFAAGAGALLVGQEKESRTLNWLRSLPLPSSDLVRTKLLVALLGLSIVWTASLLLGWTTGAWNTIRDGRGSELIWPLHSLFLMLVGLATAWRLRSSLIALLLVVPIACIPLLLAGLHQSTIDWKSSHWNITTSQTCATVDGDLLGRRYPGCGMVWLASRLELPGTAIGPYLCRSIAKGDQGFDRFTTGVSQHRSCPCATVAIYYAESRLADGA